MSRFVFRRVIPALLALLAVLGGCAGSRPAQFYLLTSLDGSGTESLPSPAEPRLAVGLFPVELPRYLDRPQIVTRDSGNEIYLSEFDLWAEPLDHNFTRALAANLTSILAADHFEVFPWKGSRPIDYRVAVQVTRFDAEPGGNALLHARWTLFRTDGKQALLRRHASFKAPVDGSGHGAIVSALSQTLADLSREIAAAISRLR